MSLALHAPVTAVTGVGPRTGGLLQDAFGIVTVRDLIEHYPRRHEEVGARLDLSRVTTGEAATLVGTVTQWSHNVNQSGRSRKLVISKATVAHEDGGSFTVTFFNQRWQETKLPVGTRAAFSGKASAFSGRLELKVPRFEVINPDGDTGLLDSDPFIPVYDATEALPSWRLATWIRAALDQVGPIEEHLPARVLDGNGLMGLDRALRSIHRPRSAAERDGARTRLVHDELFTLQVGLQWRRRRLEAETVGLDNAHVPGGRADQLLTAFPYPPTGAQLAAFDQIGRDLGEVRPMHRLLQGDVGSGKTLVALWAMLCATDQGRQAALMAPTEVLAEQHFRTLLQQLAPLGVNVLDGLRVELLTSSRAAKERRRILAELLEGRIDLVVGTHALLEEGVRFRELGLVVIDEQHRFGVSQRVQLRDKGSSTSDGSGRLTMPDVLVMTATPIPRSLALTVYGDLDLTVLDELPVGRTPIITQWIRPEEERVRRPRPEAFIRDQAALGHRTYVVCPLVEDSDEVDAKSAVSEHARLARDVFPDLTVALVHGRLTSDDKEAAMAAFRRGEADVLVATTVIEVGIDVPEATIMVLENADRFGISQLHQLRGRVGRGPEQSYCVLFADPTTDEATQRLEAIVATTDGFALAEEDLQLRGAGQLFGVRQSGVPDLKLVDLRKDADVLQACKHDAMDVLAEDPDLAAADHAPLRRVVLMRFRGGLEELEALASG